MSLADHPPDPVVPAPAGPAGAGRFFSRRRVVFLSLLVAAAVPLAGWRYHITRPEYRFARGEEAIRAKDYQAAEAYADSLAAGSPDHAHFLRAAALFDRSQPYQALKECNQINGDGPLGVRAAVLSGKCLLDMGDTKEARRVFRYALDRDPDTADAHRGLGAIAYDLGQTAEAEAHLEEVARLDPADARPHRLLAHIRRDAGNLPLAEVSFREAIRVGFPAAATTDAVRVELAENLVRRAKFAEAVTVLDAVAPESAKAVALAVRVQALRGAGRRQDAVAAADRGLADFPAGEFARLRGQLYAEDGDAKAAIPLLERAARPGPDAARTHYHYQDLYQAHFLLAQVYAADGRQADADQAAARAEEIRRDLDAATQLSQEAAARPSDAAVRLRLAAVFARLGDAGLAKMWRDAAAACGGK